MGSEFLAYLRLGVAHIADLAGYDHLLFVAALTGAYPARAWRRLVVLVTAFTVGHSVTLALATLRLVVADARVVEALIPATILVTALVSIALARRVDDSRGWRRGGDRGGDAEGPRGGPLLYALALGFGLVHGLGFSSYLRALLGAEASIALPLLAFNLGLEAGQLLIVAATLLAGAVVTRVMGARRDWVLLLGGATAGLSLLLLLQRLPALRGGAGVP
ncbi:HupE/UreJ family protein [Roseisolibacter sp. H3M3-2]|uniref:HupE/UreJ family protein n=1 Tax=Roseisolibacter sp. H3M3-2 TaxID=3031323 RepID=UPI0023DC13EA|nr:HupE/UreJ family protein [Roseisolibacter sp. H3M3-2]MDF1504575.1 HupE/UreJ family protein [Roseisolibacter sp. H3M3-2]